LKNNYDVFISFKNTEEGLDKKLAHKVYKHLIENGLKVFFSDITLAEKGIDNWNEEIHEAIEKSKFFIAVGTEKSYMESKYPQMERTSFLTLKRKDKKKVIYSYIGGRMTIDNLPNELRNIQCFQDKDENVLDNILTFILNSIKKNYPEKSKLKSTNIPLDEKPSDITFNLDNFIKNKSLEIVDDNIEVEEENTIVPMFDLDNFVKNGTLELVDNNIEVEEKNTIVSISNLFKLIIIFGNLVFLVIYSLKYLTIFLSFNLVILLFSLIFNNNFLLIILALIHIFTFIGGFIYYFLI